MLVDMTLSSGLDWTPEINVADDWLDCALRVHVESLSEHLLIDWFGWNLLLRRSRPWTVLFFRPEDSDLLLCIWDFSGPLSSVGAWSFVLPKFSLDFFVVPAVDVDAMGSSDSKSVSMGVILGQWAWCSEAPSIFNAIRMAKEAVDNQVLERIHPQVSSLASE